MIPRFKFNISLIFKLPYRISGTLWDATYTHLNEYNKSVITLSSSALILSFTAIQIGQLNVDKSLLLFSWIFLIFVLISGVALFFLNYLYVVICGLLLKNTDKKLFKTKIEFLASEEATYYFYTRILMYYLSLFQLLAFSIGIIMLVLVAYNNI